MSQSLVWSLLGIFTATLSQRYAKLLKKEFKDVQTLFLSIFSCLFMSCKTVLCDLETKSFFIIDKSFLSLYNQ
jgi:hypothetical protein